MSAAPFFIVGCGRSGTSLLRDILNAHSKLAVPLESLFIVDYLRAGDRMPRDEMLALLLREPELREWGIRPTARDLRDARTPTEAVERLHLLYASRHGKERWGQKTPRFVRHLELLRRSFPDARFIHLVRDPRAVASSLIHSDVHRSSAWHAARRWVMDVGAGLAFEDTAPHSVLRVRYEDLVRQPEPILGDITRFLGIAYEPEMLSRRGGRDEYSAFYEGIHANLDRPPTEEFVDRWKSRLSAEEISLVSRLTGELARPLGYDCETVPPAHPAPAHWRHAARRLPGLFRQGGRYLGLRREYLVHLLRRKRRMGLLGEFLCGVNY